MLMPCFYLLLFFKLDMLIYPPDFASFATSAYIPHSTFLHTKKNFHFCSLKTLSCQQKISNKSPLSNPSITHLCPLYPNQLLFYATVYIRCFYFKCLVLYMSLFRAHTGYLKFGMLDQIILCCGKLSYVMLDIE